VAQTHQNESILPRSREISCVKKVNRDAKPPLQPLAREHAAGIEGQQMVRMLRICKSTASWYATRPSRTRADFMDRAFYRCKKQKADVVGHREVSHHVGLLCNEPPASPGCPLHSLPTSSLLEHRSAPCQPKSSGLSIVPHRQSEERSVRHYDDVGLDVTSAVGGDDIGGAVMISVLQRPWQLAICGRSTSGPVATWSPWPPAKPMTSRSS
jgi:hypothetical protein